MLAGFLICNGAREVGAVEFEMPTHAIITAQREEVATVQPLPAGAFNGADTAFLNAEGQVTHTAYKIASTSLTPFQMLEPLKKQLKDQGYTSVFSCADTVCGGFDFRYLLDLLPVPHMRVDLGNFQYFLAQNFSGDSVAIVTSRARTAGFLHVTQIDTQSLSSLPTAIPPSAGLPDPIDTTLSTQLPANALGDLARRLVAKGSVPLDDLSFETGSSSLGSGPFQTLKDIATYLSQTPDARLVLVGHTDAEGSLSGNINLSRKRASSVRDRLIATYGVAANQVSAEGIGYLSPRASNANDEGRDQNRRVEAVLASTP
jgi:OOP family OmpA-OmpF porin